MQHTKDVPQFTVPYATTKRSVKEAFGPYAEYVPDQDTPLRRMPGDAIALWIFILGIYGYVGYLLFA